MLRKLLACLALLTGLAAAGAPAQAEVASALTSRIEASDSGAIMARKAPVAVAPRAAPGRALDGPHVAWPLLDLPSATPSVRLGSDRARE